MLLLSKEATAKDKSLKTQLLFTTNDEKGSETENIWRRPGFFGDQKRDFSISKMNFPENTFCYANSGIIITVKGEFAIYLDYVILVQLI